MVLVLPFLLIIVSWDSPAPGETMALSRSLHLSQDLCEAEAVRFLEERGHAGRNYRTFCVPTPSAEEFDRVFERAR